MSVLIAISDPFQNEAIRNWLHICDPKQHIYTASSRRDVEAICSEWNPELVIVGTGDYSSEEYEWLIQISKLNHVAHLIVIVENIARCEVARLSSVRRLKIIHKTDAKEYFSNGIYQNNSVTSFLSYDLQRRFGHIPPKGHPLKLLNKFELRLLHHLIQGYTSAEISLRIFRSRLTVDDYRKKIKDKLYVSGGKNALLDYITPFTHWIATITNE